MSFFTKPQELSDEALDAIHEDAEQKTAALAERNRRIEERKAREEAEARAKADAEKREKVDALLAEHAAVAEEAVRAHGAIGAGVIGLASALGKRDDLLRRAWALQSELRALGSPAPAFSLTFTREAMTAGRLLVPLVDREMTEAPFASAARNFPDAFRK